MCKRKILVALLLLSVCTIVASQELDLKGLKFRITPGPTPRWEVPEDYGIITRQEILERCKEWGETKHSAPPFDRFDGAVSGVGIVVQSPLSELRSLRNYAHKINVVWQISKDEASGERMLVIKDIVSDDIEQKRFARLKKQLVGKYGTDGGGTIRASWFDGSIRVLYAPIETVVGKVSKFEEVFEFEKGVLISARLSPNYKGSIEFYDQISQGGLRKRYVDGVWYKNGYGIEGLEAWLNSNCRPDSVDIKHQKWLLTTDTWGVSRLTVLRDDMSVDGLDENASTYIADILAKLPALSFGFLITTDGRLYGGRFIDASYSPSEGWTLSETLDPAVW